MGCDIHILIEKKVDDRWVMVDRIKHPTPARERNYYIFSLLANVRGGEEGFPPRGLPDDLSDSGKLFYEEWEDDAHSMSHLSLTEALHVYLMGSTDLSNYARDYPATHFFDLHVDEDKCNGNFTIYDDYRIVFWFDN